jgi:hypothetical protein
MARLLVQRGVGKALERFNAAQGVAACKQQPGRGGGARQHTELTQEELFSSVPLAQQLPLVPHKGGGGAAGAAAAAQQQRQAAHALTRRQLHGDMAVVVLSLRWPEASISQPMAGAAIAASGQRSSARAKYHWHLLRQYCK